MKFYLAALLLLLVLTASALDMKEDIKVYGNGSMYAKTNTVFGADKLVAIGDQSYSRSFSKGGDPSFLETTYECINISNKSPMIFNNSTSYYYIAGESRIGTQHSLKIASNESIKASARVESGTEQFSTQYAVESTFGNLSEQLVERIEIDSEMERLNFLAETQVMGNLTLTSDVDEKQLMWEGYEVDQLQKLTSVKTMGDPIKAPQLIVESGYAKSDADKIEFLINVAREVLKQTNPPEEEIQKALSYIDEAISQDLSPEAEEIAWIIKGNIRMRQQFYKEAVEDYDKAIRINPDDPEAYKFKGIALASDNKLTEAVDVLDEVTQKFPDYYDGWTARGEYIKELGNLDDALISADKAIEINPERGDAWLLKGQVLYRKLRIDDCGQNCCQDALDAIEQALKDENLHIDNREKADEYKNYLEELNCGSGDDQDGSPGKEKVKENTMETNTTEDGSNQ